MITLSSQFYGRDARNRLGEVRKPGPEGARALVESFYFAFNQRNAHVLRRVWAEDELIQLCNPLGGILRGYEHVAALYGRVFGGATRVWVELEDIVEFQAQETVVFSGRERGEYTQNGTSLPLAIRTTRVVQWLGPEIGWRQVHHHGSIDDAQMLARYQANLAKALPAAPPL